MSYKSSVLGSDHIIAEISNELMILGLLGRLRRHVRLALLLVALMQIIDLGSFVACLLLGISVSVLLLSFQTEYSSEIDDTWYSYSVLSLLS